MSSCLSSRACGFDVEHMLKWPCTIISSRTTSNSSSPSSTLSESSNSPIAISTRKPRTPRKRPNQTYNEAAALLSMACPNIFSTKHLTKRTTNLPNITKLHLNEEPELIWSFQAVENSGFLIGSRVIEKPGLVTGPKIVILNPNAGEGETDPSCVCVDMSDECLDDFDTESILDEEIELGIDSIMGHSKLNEENNELSNNNIAYDYNTCYGYPVGLGFGLINGARALRKGGERNWCSVPMVDVVNISAPVVVAKGEKSTVGKKMKKKKVDDLMKLEKRNVKPGYKSLGPENGHGLGLKLNYDDVLNAWSDKELPMPEELSRTSSLGVDINARAAKIDLFSENGGWSESGATRCMDKKKIRHQVKNAVPDKRARCKLKVREVRRKGSIVLNVTSSEIASLLLTGRRTAHSRFAVPLNPIEDSFCNISADNPLTDLIREARLIIWDETPMIHKHCFEALERTMRDIIQGPNLHKPFGGKVIVFGGDFRQILPVIPRGNREEIVNASLNHSFLCDHCRVLTLTQNMRLHSDTNTQDKEEIKKFAEWILTVGEGMAGGNNDGATKIELPKEVLIESEKNHVESIVSAIFPSIAEHLNDKGYFEDMAILVPTNEEVDSINEYVLSKIKGDERIYFSSDSVCQSEFIDEFQQSLYAPEILNGFKVSGIPNHKLVLKEGVPVMLLRNIDQSNRLCNGTRLRITRLGKHVIEAEVISGNNIGYKTYIPIMKLIPSDIRIPFIFNRRQFPLVVSFSMTINKSQGKSLSTVGLYLQCPVFIHGQLYVAISRVKSKKGLKVLICDKDAKTKNSTTNVVYKEVLQKMMEDM